MIDVPRVEVVEQVGGVDFIVFGAITCTQHRSVTMSKTPRVTDVLALALLPGFVGVDFVVFGALYSRLSSRRCRRRLLCLRCH